MIKEFEKYHGAVFTRLLHGISETVTIDTYPTKSHASYVVNKKIGLYIKHSTNRMTPWVFTFKKIHQDEIIEIKNKLGEIYIVFVCHDDGIVCLSFDEFKKVLDHNHEDIEWVRIARNPRQKYSVSGKDGKLRFKIGENEFPKKLFDSSTPKPGIFSWIIGK
ncbi:MAG: hypothetical protein K9L76_00645 [Candidatus Omnitrophica bacterium]|nr:hypothetical protein [Candidatus Omnitrophota bacterium]